LHAYRFIEDEKERRKWQVPEDVLNEVGVKTGLAFVDVGCGDGFFAFPAARLVGNEGKVYALDADAEAIEKLREKAAREGLLNVELKVGMAEESVFCDSCADIVFFGIVLHDFTDPDRVLSNAKRMLKSSGRLVNLDWKKEPMQLGPPLQVRFNEKKALDIIASAGFRIDQIRGVGLYHYVIIATPKF
jgi:ubiquinone/menaquinone biosynthesis C-methylase UbiE